MKKKKEGTCHYLEAPKLVTVDDKLAIQRHAGCICGWESTSHSKDLIVRKQFWKDHRDHKTSLQNPSNPQTTAFQTQ